MSEQNPGKSPVSPAEGDVGGIPVRLVDLPQATKIPNVPVWWSLLCWLVFFFGVAVMLLALATLGGFGFQPSGMIPLVFGVLPLAFTLAATNTFLAATRFDKRQRAIVQWIRSRMDWRSAQVNYEVREEGVRDETLQGEIAIRDRGAKNVDDPLDIHVSGLYAPREYQSEDSKQTHNFQFAVYVDHIRAETRDARTTCAKLAAAVGGLFITGIQIYGRLIQLIEVAGRQ